MSYRPYPDVDRALAQMERRRATQSPSPMLAWIDEVVAPLRLAEWQRAWLNATVTVSLPKRTGRAALSAAIAEQAVKDGEHVHVAGRDGVRCAGGDAECALPKAESELSG